MFSWDSMPKFVLVLRDETLNGVFDLNLLCFTSVSSCLAETNVVLSGHKAFPVKHFEENEPTTGKLTNYLRKLGI